MKRYLFFLADLIIEKNTPNISIIKPLKPRLRFPKREREAACYLQSQPPVTAGCPAVRQHFVLAQPAETCRMHLALRMLVAGSKVRPG